jgi:hypothetical protein
MTRMGNLFLMVNLLRAWKLGHILQEPSFFKTTSIFGPFCDGCFDAYATLCR